MRLAVLLGTLAFAGAASAAPAMLERSTPPEMYSFAELYRLTVAGTPGVTLPPLPGSAPSASAGGSHAGRQAALAESEPLRPVAISAPRGEEARFLIGTRRDSEGWLIALAGFILAGWVAARRLA